MKTVKRYSPTTKYIGTGDYVGDMEEDACGDYAEWEDYLQLERELAEIEKMRCLFCDYIAPENEKDWPNSECVVCMLGSQLDKTRKDLANVSNLLEVEVRNKIDAPRMLTIG